MKKTPRTSFKAFRIVGSCALLLAVQAAQAAGSTDPAHHLKSASINGKGSITIATLPDGRSYQATIYGNVTFNVVLDSGDSLLEVVMKDGVASAKLNDEPIDADRIHLDDNALRIVDAAGDTLFDATVAPGVVPEKPRVMLGVTVEAPSEALQSQLQLDPDAVVIGQVYPDTPAADAGLEPFDILVSLDGKRVTRQNLTPMINKKKSGDVIKLVATRRGKPVEINATLTVVSNVVGRFNAIGDIQLSPIQAHLQALPPTLQGAIDGAIDWRADALKEYQIAEQQLQDMHRGLSDNRQRLYRTIDDIRSAQEQMMSLQKRADELRTKIEQIRADKRLNSAQRKDSLKATQDALEGAQSSIDLLSLQLSEAVDAKPRIRFFRNDDDDDEGDDGGVVVFQPSNPGSFGAGDLNNSAARLDAMEQRLDRIETLLEQLIEQRSGERAPAPSSHSEKPAGT